MGAALDSWAVEAAQERALLGLYTRGHPLRDFTRQAQEDARLRAVTARELADCLPNERITMVGVVVEVKTHTTKKRQDMAFVTVEDATGQFSATVFPMVLTMFASTLIVGHLVVIEGRASHRPDGKQRHKAEGDEEGGHVEATTGVKVELVVENCWPWEDRVEEERGG